MVDWGVITAISPKTRRIEVEVGAPARIRSSLHGLRVEPDMLQVAGRYQLSLYLQQDLLIPNALIEADLLIESDGQVQCIRVTGSVDDSGIESGQTSVTIMEKPWALIHKLAGHSGRVRAVAFAEEGQILVSGGDDCTVRYWDPVAGEQLDFSGKFDSEVWCVSTSRDGHLIAIGLRNGKIYLKEALELRTLWIKQFHQGYISGLAFSPDSTVLAAGSGDRSVSVINTSSGALLYPPIKPEAAKAGVVTSIALSANGLVLATASQIGNRILLWEVQDGKLLRELNGHKGTVWTLAFSLDGYLLVSGSNDKTVCLWNTQTGNVASVLEGFRSYVFCVAVSPDGNLVATASAEPKVRVWHIASGQRLASIDSGNQWMRHLTFSPDQRWLAGASDDGHVYVWAASGAGVGDSVGERANATMQR